MLLIILFLFFFVFVILLDFTEIFNLSDSFVKNVFKVVCTIT